MPSLNMSNVVAAYHGTTALNVIYSGTEMIWTGVPQDNVTDPNYFVPYNVYVHRWFYNGQYQTLIDGLSDSGGCDNTPPLTDAIRIWTRNQTLGTPWTYYGFFYPTWRSCGQWNWYKPGAELFSPNDIQEVAVQVGETSTWGPFGYSPLEVYGGRS